MLPQAAPVNAGKPPPLPTFVSPIKKVTPPFLPQNSNGNATPPIRPDITSPVFSNLAENLSAVLLARRKDMLKEEKESATS
jgi:hypothetical protein